MTDWNQFEERDAAKPAACTVCEAMLPDAVDGALTTAEHRAFEQHVAGCVSCAREYEEAQRGAAWLSMLKTQTPEPPADLLARILAETTGVAAAASPIMREEAVREWVPQGSEGHPANGIGFRLAAFGRKLADVFSIENSRMTFQPRLAMTAAMAFFSIALTLNLTGVRLSNVRASNFTPGGIRRTVADAGASAARSFQNMRVVYQVESRVSELRNDAVFSNGRTPEETAPANPANGKDNGSVPQGDAGQTQGGSNPQSGNGDSKQDPKPHGHSELVFPMPAHGGRGGAALRKDL
ncbi:MAG: zf-HC2 domain-containing protein [Acidobacteriota bacterium]